MKKLLTLIMLAAFAFNCVGNIIVIQFLQYRFSQEMRAQIKSSLSEKKLHLIKLKESELNQLNWYEEDEEFEYQGMMYDLVKIKKLGGLIYYYCITDTEETQLNKTLDTLVQHQLDHSKKANILKKTSKVYIYNFATALVTNSCKLLANQHNLNLEDNFINLYSPDILVPPPKNFS